jgi:hypothetical protein
VADPGRRVTEEAGAPKKAGSHIANEDLVTPRAAAIAGILFAVLFSISYTLILRSTPELDTDTGAWLISGGETAALAVGLIPFAGIAFLWFMAVVRDRLGHLEDQFFSTLFFGSGLLYLAMVFTASALFGGLVYIAGRNPDMLVDTNLYPAIRAMIYQIVHEYSIRMAGMFMIVLGTIWLRTLIMPRWLVGFTYLFALILLFSISFSEWIMMVFPTWVLLTSIYILILNYRREGHTGPAADGMTLED